MPSSIELAESLLSTLPAVAHALARATRDESDWDTHGMIQMRTLVMLKDGPKTFKDLCAFRGVAPPTLSRSVTAMVRRGWITRSPHPQDKRQLMLAVTPGGAEHLQRIGDAFRKRLGEALEQLSADERQILANSVDILKRTAVMIHARPLAAVVAAATPRRSRLERGSRSERGSRPERRSTKKSEKKSE